MGRPTKAREGLEAGSLTSPRHQARAKQRRAYLGLNRFSQDKDVPSGMPRPKAGWMQESMEEVVEKVQSSRTKEKQKKISFLSAPEIRWSVQ